MYAPQAIENALQKGLTDEQRQLLHAAHVAVCGLGGLGSNVAMWLARLGVGTLTLIDFDKVELSNLNRQYYFLEDVGQYKATALTKHLQQVNPYGKYQPHITRLAEDNVEELLQAVPYICEALDDPAAKAMLVSTVLSTMPEKKVVAASGMAGFGSGNEVLSKRISNNLYLCGDGVSDFRDLPLCGARVGICAAQQALTLARLILKALSQQMVGF